MPGRSGIPLDLTEIKHTAQGFSGNPVSGEMDRSGETVQIVREVAVVQNRFTLFPGIVNLHTDGIPDVVINVNNIDKVTQVDFPQMCIFQPLQHLLGKRKAGFIVGTLQNVKTEAAFQQKGNALHFIR